MRLVQQPRRLHVGMLATQDRQSVLKFTRMSQIRGPGEGVVFKQKKCSRASPLDHYKLTHMYVRVIKNFPQRDKFEVCHSAKCKVQYTRQKGGWRGIKKIKVHRRLARNMGELDGRNAAKCDHDHSQGTCRYIHVGHHQSINHEVSSNRQTASRKEIETHSQLASARLKSPQKLPQEETLNATNMYVMERKTYVNT